MTVVMGSPGQPTAKKSDAAREAGQPHQPIVGQHIPIRIDVIPISADTFIGVWSAGRGLRLASSPRTVGPSRLHLFGLFPFFFWRFLDRRASVGSQNQALNLGKWSRNVFRSKLRQNSERNSRTPNGESEVLR